MTTEALEAWVLHKTPSGDTSAFVTFFTREKGIFQSLCKGGRTPKKQAVLQPFLPLWLAIDLRKNWHFIRHIETLEAPVELKSSSLFAGLYVNELLYYLLGSLDAQPALFDLYQQTIRGLSITTDKLAIEALLRRFEWALLVVSGYAISFTSDARSGLPIALNQRYQFIVDEGFVSTNEGIMGEAILALAQGQLEEVQVLKVAKYIMRQAIEHLLDGRELKSRSLFLSTKASIGTQIA